MLSCALRGDRKNGNDCAPGAARRCRRAAGFAPRAARPAGRPRSASAPDAGARPSRARNSARAAGRSWAEAGGCDRGAPGAVLMRARLVRCAASADAAGGGAAGGAAAACTGAALGGAVRAGRGWRATGSGRLEKLRVKEAMTCGALPHGGGGRCFFLPGSRRFERPSAACARRGSRVAAPAPTAVGASPRPPLAAWVRVCPGSAARKRFERPSWRGGKRRNPAEKAAAGGLFRRALCACLNKL